MTAEPRGGVATGGDVGAIRLRIDGCEMQVPRGTLVAAACALLSATEAPTTSESTRRVVRRSVAGEPRHAFCGMGVCGECRVTIDGRPHRLGCLVMCEDGMEVRRADGS
jgi:hypothetical protein